MGASKKHAVICHKKHKSPKNILAAVKAAARLEEIEKHGKLISFRRTITKNKKKYNRKRKWELF